ncbi:hypothetical protein [Dietzia kunjamensis]|uniref:hypothetical protein n=1 Tax=Dietzia kunjamensis TaxID=322509 RepID=UPI003368C492
MNNSGYARQIRDGLYDPSPQHSIGRVKSAVASELEALDASAEIRSTEYFNHTFAPDFVLRWPDTTERQVFLRLSYDKDALAEDVELIDVREPFIFGLTPDESTGDDATIEEAISRKGGMFAEPDSLETLITRQPIDSTARMLSNAIVQGGQGTFTGNSISELAETVSRGFAAASEAESSGTASAVAALTEHLGTPQAHRMTRVLQAVWEGRTGSISSFPGGSTDTSGRLDIESLRYLLEYMDTADSDFWRRVGRQLQLSDLEELDFATINENFQSLINSNLDVLRARATRLIEDPLGVTEIGRKNEFVWSKRRGRLTFEGPGFFMFLGAAKKQLEDIPANIKQSVSVETFIERAQDSELVEVKLQAASEEMTLYNRDERIDAARLHGFAAQLRATPSVVQTVVSTPTGRITVDIEGSSAAGITRSNVLMADLLLYSLPLVRTLDPELRESASRQLAYEASSDIEFLFDDSFLDEADFNS